MIYKDQLMTLIKKELRTESFFMRNCPNGITSLNGHEVYQVIF